MQNIVSEPRKKTCRMENANKVKRLRERPLKASLESSLELSGCRKSACYEVEYTEQHYFNPAWHHELFHHFLLYLHTKKTEVEQDKGISAFIHAVSALIVKLIIPNFLLIHRTDVDLWTCTALPAPYRVTTT